MTNQIIEAITTAIGNEFGDGYNIYIEQIEQELDEPCFFVHQINGKHDLFLWNRYHDTHHFDVQYFPGTESIQTECNGVSDRLEQALEYIFMYDSEQQLEEKPIRGTNMHSDIQDGVLHFFIDYNGFVIKQVELGNMENVSQNISVRE